MPQEYLESFAGEKDIWNILLILLTQRPDPDGWILKGHFEITNGLGCVRTQTGAQNDYFQMHPQFSVLYLSSTSKYYIYVIKNRQIHMKL